MSSSCVNGKVLGPPCRARTARPSAATAVGGRAMTMLAMAEPPECTARAHDSCQVAFLVAHVGHISRGIGDLGKKCCVVLR